MVLTFLMKQANMTDLSCQIGYIICGGQLLDLNNTLEVSNASHRTSPENVVKHLPTTAQDFQNNDSNEYLSLMKNSKSSQSQERDARVTTICKVNARESIVNSLPDATNKSSNYISDSTATLTTVIGERNAMKSTNFPLLIKTTTQNYEPAFCSDVIVLGKMILAIRKPACEESHKDVKASLAAAKGRVSFTDGAVLSGNSTSNANNSIPISIAAINNSSLVAQNTAKPNNGSDKNSDSNTFSTSSPSLFLELGFSDSSCSLNPQTNSSNSYYSSPSDSSGSLVKVFDASGFYVIPGFIDCHMHAFQYSTPLGIKVDECCLQRGVTTAIDAGSAGEVSVPILYP